MKYFFLLGSMSFILLGFVCVFLNFLTKKKIKVYNPDLWVMSAFLFASSILYFLMGVGK